jgi:hypothetical protein
MVARDVGPPRAAPKFGCDVIDSRFRGFAYEIGNQKVAPVEARPSPLRS